MLVKINGTEIYFDVEGGELRVAAGKLIKRPTIVVLHGGPGFDQGYLRPGLSALSDNAQLVYVDLRGQGRSGRPSLETCTLEQMADDVAQLCIQLGIEHPILFGHSAGGFVALHLALRHPGVLGGLILCDTSPTLAPLPDPEPTPGLADRAGPEATVAAGRMFGGDFSPESMDAFTRLVVPYYSAPSHMDVPGRLMALSTMNTALSQHFFSRLAPAYDVRPRLSEISVPTLVIVGHYDWVCPPRASRALANGIPGAELFVLETAGHFVFSEEPDLFLSAVRQYLDRVP